MDVQISQTCESITDTLAAIRAKCPRGAQIVFVSGKFEIIHAGHLRLLNFAAECGTFLVVGVTADSFDVSVVPESLRLEGMSGISAVNHAFILRIPPEEFVAQLRPRFVVKGKEHESEDNPEQAAVNAYGGKLLFSSGDARFSSLDLLQREINRAKISNISKPKDYPRRHGFGIAELSGIVDAFTNLRVVVVGDLIIDEYVTCEALGMSREDPTLVVTPLKSDRFIGGAGIVAAHARGLGAEVTYFGVVGKDEPAEFAATMLKEYGVNYSFLVDETRPTTFKQRFRTDNKTLLRLSHLRQHDIGTDLIEEFLRMLKPACEMADLVIFSDFNYGMLPQSLVDRLSQFCAERDIVVVADSQASSQMADVSRFKGMKLLTPTEHEARLAVRDSRSGLRILAEKVQEAAQAELLIITLGADGVFVHVPNLAGSYKTDQLPAFNSAPKDVAGAGDCLLICTSMALVTGANVWRAAYLGSLAAACQVDRIGNSPLTAAELIRELQR